MIEVKGKYNNAKIFTDVVEGEAVSQIIELCNQEAFKDSKIRIMPDVHAGVGCTIGTTMTIKDKVVPNLVGVDIGCLDCETEVLTPNGWIKISEYNNNKILIYDYNTDVAYFDYPNAFVKDKCDEFYHFSNSKNLDQMVSAEHHLLVYQGYKSRDYKLKHYLASDFFNMIKNNVKSDFYNAKTQFLTGENGLPYSDDIVRLMIAISADGRVKPLKNGNVYVEMHFRKQRKIDRIKMILDKVKIKYNIHTYKDLSTCVSFSVDKDIGIKDLTCFYLANLHQLKVVCEEAICWDGAYDTLRNHKYYSSTNKNNADIIQFAFTATGVRSTIYVREYKNKHWNKCYYVIPTKNAYVGYKNDDASACIVPSVDGYKYCFNTKTGAFVVRRNNRISVTGNCGMFVCDLGFADIDYEKLDKIIRSRVPSGFDVRDSIHPFLNNVKLKDLCCIDHINLERAELSLGTLGGGNHFIEIDKDGIGRKYLIIHSGSRNLGVNVCKYYQEQAYLILKKKYGAEAKQNIIEKLKSEGKASEIESELKKITVKSVSKDLAWCEGKLFNEYIHDMKIVQTFAKWNRKAMAYEILNGLGLRSFDEFTTIHNYIDAENLILRKGAVSARKDEKLIIPINMRDGSLICVGKGNPDWNYSAPHGAGRIMSRAKAKENISLDEFEKSMEGIFTTSVNSSTIDESPMAYKSAKDIVDNIGDTVEITKIIKPIYNFKA